MTLSGRPKAALPGATSVVAVNGMVELKLMRTALGCRTRYHAQAQLLDLSFQCPPKDGSNWLLEASEKGEANQRLMSSVPNRRSHEVWRETAGERANRPPTAQASQEIWAEKPAVIGIFGPGRSGETVRIGLMAEDWSAQGHYRCQ